MVDADKDKDPVPVVSYYLALEPITFYPGPSFPIPTLVCTPGNVMKIAIAHRDEAKTRVIYLFSLFYEAIETSETYHIALRKPIVRDP